MGSMDDGNVFLRDVTAGEQEYARSLLRGARVLYLAKVTKVEDRKLSVDGAGREHDAAPMERILVLGAYRLFSIKRRMTGLACIRQGHAQDLERVAYVEREGGRAVLQIEFRRGYEDRGGFLMTVPWETPTTSTLARSLWELWLRSGGALERRRPTLEGHLLERLAASASLDAGDAPALHVALYSRLRHRAALLGAARGFDLSGNGVGAAGAAALAGLARGCGLLRALRLRRCDVGGGAAGFAALVRALAPRGPASASLAAALRGATSPAGPALRVLDLGENPLRDAGAAIVATFVGAASCRLRVLSVARCGAPLSELLRALREAARRDARLPAPLRGVAASLVRLDVSGNLLHPLARLGANEDARRLASVAEELPKLRELACGDLRYATTLSPAARGEDVAAVLTARSGARARLSGSASSTGARLQRDLGPLVAALAGAAPKLRVLNVAECGGGDDLCDAGLEALGLLLSRSAALEQLACDGQRLGPQKVTLAGLRALRDGVLGAAEGPLLQLASPLADAAGARDRKDDAREIVACVRAMREAMRAQICDRAAPNSVPYDVLCVVTARESDRCAGELDAPAPDGFVTTEAVAAFPAGDPPGAYDGDDDDGDPRPPRATSRRGARVVAGRRRTAAGAAAARDAAARAWRARRAGVARADVAALAASARAQCGREGHTHRRDAKLRRRSSGSAEAGALVASVKNLATGGVRSLRTAKTAATMGLAHRQFQKELAKLLADDAGAGRRGKRSVVFHSFRLMFGRATIPRSADVFFRKRARADHPPSKRRRITTGDGAVERACDAYMARAAATFRDHVLREGGFQVKIGQMVAMQKALLPLAVTETLAPCCDAARAAPFSSLEKAVAERLGVHRLDEIFARVDHRPIGAASVAQVHRATLRRNWVLDAPRPAKTAPDPAGVAVQFVDTGDVEVVLKIQHAGVADFMRADVAFLPYLSAMVRALEPDHGLESFVTLVEDMLAQEVDFRIEGHNRERLAAILERSGRSARSAVARVRLPRVHWALTREGVMVQDFVARAAALGDRAAVEALGVPFTVAVSELSQIFATGSGASPGVRAWLRRGFLAFVYGSLVVVAAAASAAVAAVAAACWAAPHPLLRTVALSVAGGAVLSRFDRHRAAAVAAAVASLGIGEHRSLVAFFDGTLYPPEKFDVVLIDHGFHTDVPDAFRLTFCKTWAAVGDANLLAEAAFELGLSDDPACLGDGEVLPLFLALLPFDAWDAGRFPSPLELVRSLRDSERGLRKLRGATGRMPKIMHVLMRANRQLLSLFQLQYGLSPQMRYEFMKTMTTHALLGLRRENPRDALPDPAALRTADAAFFEAELPG
ncbi:hypothetical protein JL722_8812 [Aureococcus anophagefferens]|nr:hypothetical protein JL722_8812 [Aureococcus anophagefferens]